MAVPGLSHSDDTERAIRTAKFDLQSPSIANQSRGEGGRACFDPDINKAEGHNEREGQRARINVQQTKGRLNKQSIIERVRGG